MYDSKETLELRVVIMCNNVFDGVRSLYIFVFYYYRSFISCTFPRERAICKERFNLDLSK